MLMGRALNKSQSFKNRRTIMLGKLIMVGLFVLQLLAFGQMFFG